MICQKEPSKTRFGVEKTWICPWQGTIMMAGRLFTVVWG